MGTVTHLGGLAVALGVGAAVVTGWAAPASATPADSSSSAAGEPETGSDPSRSPATPSQQVRTDTLSDTTALGTDTPARQDPDDAEDTDDAIGPDGTETDTSGTDPETRSEVATPAPDATEAAPDIRTGASGGAAASRHTASAENSSTGPERDTDLIAGTDAAEPDADTVPVTDVPEIAPPARTSAAPVAAVTAAAEEPLPEPLGVATRVARSDQATAEVAPVSVALLNPLAAPLNTDTPGEPPTLWTLLAFVRRELQRTFFNSHPHADPMITSQTDDLVTGTIGAVDPDGDRLVYTIVGRGPALGRVSIDQETGAFTYTPVVDFSTLGGSDRFTVEISDETRPHLHGLAALWEVPINLLRRIPVIGSLLSDFLPSTAPRVTVTITFPGTGDATDLAFPDGFRWGVATSGFQSEMGGGAPLDKNSDWWQWLHDPFNKFLIGWKRDALPENGPGSYLRYETDAQLAANGVGADTFRMGIEWSRIFPGSTASVDISGGITPEVLGSLDALADQTEVAHYRDVLQTLHSYGLDPMVTINHFTLPKWVHDPASARNAEVLGRTPREQGGWVSDSTITEFEKYSAYLAWKLGDQVTNWVVLNEPMNSMIPAYFAIPFGTGFPPGVLRPDLLAAGLRNQAAAYSASYDVIHQLDGDANVGFALSMFDWRGANPTSPRDRQAAAQFGEFFNTWFPDAVIKGEVDADFDGVIGTDELHPELAGKADFFGVNYYGQGSVIGFGRSPFPAIPVLTGYPQFANLLNVVLGGCPAEECSEAPLVVKPSGLRTMLDLAASYRKPLWITENGLADADDSLRASYLVRHLAVINDAIHDGADIRGYIAWSLLDNLEWILGYEHKFGLYAVDPVTLERTPRPSVAVINAITTGNSIPADLFQQYVKATGP